MEKYAPIVPFNWRTEPFLVLDFSEANPELPAVNVQDTAQFSEYVFGKLHAANVRVGVGGYNERRVIYARSSHFQQTAAPRCVHLGVDVWAAAGTSVCAPLAGRVHGFANNAHFGDYGPTIILEHLIDNQPLFSLYGHLSLESLAGLYEGKPIEKGQQIGSIGTYPTNGDWPPHLHFQLITDMRGLKGDFPGVCTLGERDAFLKICPNPNLMLGLV
ncbi:MAG: peptidase M23 [Cytophagia bacterium]|nr:MAG: peptidase M23 [Cytophagales bacterium]TAG41399.1 MAG: peptidase M23 [Cytophagia bacterium]TAG71209.1 MAG: peptidase M23 [Runella slithyformis]TAG83157.1 MAG: peptidase M23 [Cytophagales bacterium]